MERINTVYTTQQLIIPHYRFPLGIDDGFSRAQKVDASILFNCDNGAVIYVCAWIYVAVVILTKTINWRWWKWSCATTGCYRAILIHTSRDEFRWMWTTTTPHSTITTRCITRCTPVKIFPMQPHPQIKGLYASNAGRRAYPDLQHVNTQWRPRRFWWLWRLSEECPTVNGHETAFIASRDAMELQPHDDYGPSLSQVSCRLMMLSRVKRYSAWSVKRLWIVQQLYIHFVVAPVRLRDFQWPE